MRLNQSIYWMCTSPLLLILYFLYHMKVTYMQTNWTHSPSLPLSHPHPLFFFSFFFSFLQMKENSLGLVNIQLKHAKRVSHCSYQTSTRTKTTPNQIQNKCMLLNICDCDTRTRWHQCITQSNIPANTYSRNKKTKHHQILTKWTHPSFLSILTTLPFLLLSNNSRPSYVHAIYTSSIYIFFFDRSVPKITPRPYNLPGMTSTQFPYTNLHNIPLPMCRELSL